MAGDAQPDPGSRPRACDNLWTCKTLYHITTGLILTSALADVGLASALANLKDPFRAKYDYTKLTGEEILRVGARGGCISCAFRAHATWLTVDMIELMGFSRHTSEYQTAWVFMKLYCRRRFLDHQEFEEDYDYLNDSD
jgi:hypothetical protein